MLATEQIIVSVCEMCLDAWEEGDSGGAPGHPPGDTPLPRQRDELIGVRCCL